MIEKTVLPNGTRVITEEIDHVRSVSIGLWVTCGSRHEDDKTNGAAHFIEHMLFKGTERRSAFDIAAAVDAVGGVMNAFTSKELTSFYIKIPDYHLPTAVDLLADIFHHSRFDPEEIDREKLVVLQEINMLEDSPDDYIHDYFETHFWGGSSLSLPVIGTRQGVAGFTRQELLSFFGKRYGGRNLVITAAGRLQHGAFVDMMASSFGVVDVQIPKTHGDQPQVVSRVTALEKDLEQVHMIIGTLAPSVSSEERYAGLLLNTVLGGSMSSRLFQEIRERRGLAYAVHSFLSPYRDTGLLGVYVGTGRKDVPEVLRLVFDEFLRMATEPVTERELYGAKELVKGNFLLSMESTDNRMTRLARNEIFFGRHIPAEELVARFDAVTAEEIRDLAREMFNPATISVAAIGPVTERELALDVLIP